MQIIITNAGLAAIVNGEATGTAAVQITKIGLGSGRYTPSKTQTALQSEFKQIDVIEGGDTGDNTIHVAIRDDSEDSYAVYEFGLYLADGTLFAVTSQQSVILQKVSTSQALVSVDIKFDGIDSASITFEGMTYSFAAATTENAGICELATEAETLAGTDSQRAVTPATLAKLLATDTRLGLIKTATADEAKTGTDAAKAVTPAALKAAVDARAASDDVAAGGSSTTQFLTPKSVLAIEAGTGKKGLVELATEAEAKAGTDATKVMTPATVKAAFDDFFASATEEQAGTVRLATPDEAKAGTDATTAVSPANLKAAVDDRAASAEEVSVGTSTTKFVTPATLKTVIDALNLTIAELTARVEELEGGSEPDAPQVLPLGD